MPTGSGKPEAQEQLRHADDTQPLLGQTPNRGVIEVMPTGDDAWVTSDSRQVPRFWGQSAGRWRQRLLYPLLSFILSQLIHYFVLLTT